MVLSNNSLGTRQVFNSCFLEVCSHFDMHVIGVKLHGPVSWRSLLCLSRSWLSVLEWSIFLPRMEEPHDDMVIYNEEEKRCGLGKVWSPGRCDQGWLQEISNCRSVPSPVHLEGSQNFPAAHLHPPWSFVAPTISDDGEGRGTFQWLVLGTWHWVHHLTDMSTGSPCHRFRSSYLHQRCILY